MCVFFIYILAEAPCEFPYFPFVRDEEIKIRCGLNVKMKAALQSILVCLLKHMTLSTK